MKVGIIQSNYIPWRGYFDFIDDADIFVFYDSTQYTRRSWRNRNKIKKPTGLFWLTVPVFFSRSNMKTIENVKIDYTHNWVKKHINSIKRAYSKAPYFKQYSEGFVDILNQNFENLSELNVNLIKWIMQELKIETDLRYSSEFQIIDSSRTGKLINILKEVGATSYLSGPSAKNYLEIEKFRKAGMDIEFKVYEYKEYPQLYGKFEQNVTVLDMLFNCGENSREYLKSLKENERHSNE